jgi:hypothetical protein
MFDRVTDVKLVQQLKALKDAAEEATRRRHQEQRERQERLVRALRGGDAAMAGGVEETQPDDVVQLQIEQMHQMVEEKRLKNQMVRLVARRLRRRDYVNVPMAARCVRPELWLWSAHALRGAARAFRGPSMESEALS